MGIRNLSSLLKKFCPESVIRPVASEDFSQSGAQLSFGRDAVQLTNLPHTKRDSA